MTTKEYQHDNPLSPLERFLRQQFAGYGARHATRSTGRHSRQFTRRYADGRQRDPAWRRAHGLP